MPSRRPNKLYGAAKAGGSEKRGGEVVYIETDPDSDCSNHREDCPVPESLHLAQQEIWRLQDAVKTLEACLQRRPQDTSAAWKTEAEKAQADAKKHKKENKFLLEELSTTKNALAHQVSAVKAQVDEAVALEAKRWEQRFHDAGQEADELRTELQHTLSRFEDLEMSKTRALFELTEERSKVHPRGVDYNLHQTMVQELSVTRTRLKDEEERSSEVAERARKEAAAATAEANQATTYLKRIVKESRAELAEAREAAAGDTAKISSLTAQNKLLQTKLDVLQAEASKRAEIQQQWGDWSLEVATAARKELLQGCSVDQDFEDMRLRLKEVEARVAASAAEAQQKLKHLASRMPKAI